MQAYPEDDSEVDAWKAGMREPRSLARTLGMAPTDDNPDESGDNGGDDDSSDDDDGGKHPDWFYRPLHYPPNKFGDMSDDDDEVSSMLNCDESNVSSCGPTLSGKTDFMFVIMRRYYMCYSCETNVVSVASFTTADLEGIQMDEVQMDAVIDDNTDAHHATQARKHSPTVTIPAGGHEVYKATLVSLLNKDPHLSHEQLVDEI